MMGAGKSVVGKRVAAIYDVDFQDTDSVVEIMAGMTVRDIFDSAGERHFRGLEAAAVIQLAGQSAVVATGGGVVLNPGNVEIMQSTGPVVWLQAPLDTLVKRVAGSRHRPLLSGDSHRERLVAILDERTHLYASAATQILDSDGLDIDQVADLIKVPW